MHTIISSPVERLVLGKTFFTPQQWASFLPKLDVPRLRCLIIEADVPVITISKFLSRHPNIRHLHISRDHNRQKFPFHPQARSRLPDLESLSGPGAYIAALLKGFDFPEMLEELNIYYCPLLTKGNYATDVNTILRYASGCEHLYSLALDIPGHTLPPSFLASDPGAGSLMPSVKMLLVRCSHSMTAKFAVSCCIAFHAFRPEPSSLGTGFAVYRVIPEPDTFKSEGTRIREQIRSNHHVDATLSWVGIHIIGLWGGQIGLDAR
jgi:hypothetical protein